MLRSTAGQTAYAVYPLSNYSFGTKDRKLEKDANVSDKIQRLKVKYEKDGMRRTVEGIVIVQEHNHPHILLLQLGSSYFRLPGGRLRPAEDEAEGLKRKLVNNLSPTNSALQTPWDVGECAGTFWRPNFDTVFYPYLPAHITKPKEVKKLFVVPLPERCMFAVPKNMKLIAVPVFELYDNPGRYGPVMSAIPQLLSRFRLNLVGSSLPAQVPNTGQDAPEAQQRTQPLPQQGSQQLLQSNSGMLQ